MAKKKFLSDWTGFMAKHLVTATVETGAPANVVMTFAPVGAVKRFQKNVATEFTIAGKTVDLLTISRTAGTVTVRVTVGWGAGAGFNMTFNPVKKGDTQTIAIDNNVA